MKAKSAGLFPDGFFENYEVWLNVHDAMVVDMAEPGYKVADVEVRVDEFLEWRKKRSTTTTTVRLYVDELRRGQETMKWYD